MSVQRVSDIYEKYGNIGVNRRFNISLKHRYMYSPVAKVGTTSLNHIFQKLEMQELNRKWIDFHPVVEHSPFVKPYQLTRKQLADILFDEDYFRFLFVRDPFRRAVSAWRDKINGNRPEKKQILKALGLPPDTVEKPVSFLEFLSAVKETPDEKRDEHWRSQTSLSCADVIPYAFLGRMESFETDIKHIEGKLGLNLEPFYPTEQLKNAVADKRPYTDDYCEETITLVQTIYADDFQRFSYNSTIKD